MKPIRPTPPSPRAPLHDTSAPSVWVSPRSGLGRRLGGLVASLALVASVVTIGASPASAVELTCERIPGLLNAFLHKHIRYRHMNDELRSRSIESYVKRLDSSKTLYIAKEAEELKASLRGIFFDVGSGECGRLEEIQKDIVVRYERMKTFVEKLLSDEDYAIDTSVELVLDPAKRAHPRTREQQQELYAKLVHFQMSNYVSSDMPLAEAKDKLNHRYELMVKRAREFSQTDVYSLFLDSFASSLDPHSNYMNAEIEEDFKIQMGLSLIGIGVALSSRDGYSVVERIIPGGGADRVDKLRPQDKVIAVAQDGEEPVDVIDMELRKVVRLIRGERDTKVHLTVLRQSPKTERFVVSIVRDKINLDEQAAKMRFEEMEIDGEIEKLAIIELPSFYGGRDPAERKCSNDILDLLKEAKEANAAGVLLDLSRNGGGLLDTARDISGFFIREGGIVAVKDEFGNVQILRDEDSRLVWDGPLVVLTSRISASASEIVAGAMKDYRRAILVGDDHTFGKGTVQTLVPLPPRLGALKVTTALFFRPGGHSTQHSGVASDIIFPSIFNSDEFGEAKQTYSLEGATIAPFLDDSANLYRSTNGSETFYTPVTRDTIVELSMLSAQRVGENEKFAKIQEKLAESEERGGVIRLSEILEEKDEGSEEEDGESTQGGIEEKDGAHTDGAKSDAENEAEVRVEVEVQVERVTTDAGESNAIVEVEVDATADGEDSDAEQEIAEETPDEPSPQQLEAIRILEDYVRILRKDAAASVSSTASL